MRKRQWRSVNVRNVDQDEEVMGQREEYSSAVFNIAFEREWKKKKL